MKFFHGLKKFMVQKALEQSHFCQTKQYLEKNGPNTSMVYSNCPSSINDNAINCLPQVGCNVLLDEFPTVTETTKEIQ